MHSHILSFLCAAALAAPLTAQASQTLGPWEVIPPGSAVMVSGGGGLWGWANTSNSSLTFTESMIQSPIEDAGYANAPIGTVMDFVFVPGVVNVPGPDLVLFDLQYDIGVYRFATNYDAFATEVTVDTTGGTVVATQDYYYELGPAFPSTEDVVGVEIDLDLLGVPEGEAIIGFRLIADNDGCDPVCLAKIDRFTLAIPPLTAGGTAFFDAVGGTPSGTIGIGYSLVGNGPTLVDTGVCGMMTAALTPPISVLTLGTGDSSGNLNYSVPVPSSASGRTVHFQALDFASCTLSNGVTRTVL